MISNGEKCRCLAVKRLSAILRGTTSKINGDYYWNYLNLFGAKKCVEKSCLLQCKNAMTN